MGFYSIPFGWIVNLVDSDLRARGRPVFPYDTLSFGQGVGPVILDDTRDQRLSPAFMQWLQKTSSGLSFARSRMRPLLQPQTSFVIAFVLSRLDNPILVKKA